MKGDGEFRKNGKIHFKWNEFVKLKQSSTKGVLAIEINVLLEVNIKKLLPSADR